MGRHRGLRPTGPLGRFAELAARHGFMHRHGELLRIFEIEASCEPSEPPPTSVALDQDRREDPNTLLTRDQPRGTSRDEFEINEAWVPRFPRPGDRPIVAARHVPTGLYLRHSKGPLQGHFLDIGPDNYLRPEIAELAIVMHLDPPRLFPMVLPSTPPIPENVHDFDPGEWRCRRCGAAYPAGPEDERLPPTCPGEATNPLGRYADFTEQQCREALVAISGVLCDCDGAIVPDDPRAYADVLRRYIDALRDEVQTLRDRAAAERPSVQTVAINPRQRHLLIEVLAQLECSLASEPESYGDLADIRELQRIVEHGYAPAPAERLAEEECRRGTKR